MGDDMAARRDGLEATLAAIIEGTWWSCRPPESVLADVRAELAALRELRACSARFRTALEFVGNRTREELDRAVTLHYDMAAAARKALEGDG